MQKRQTSEKNVGWRQAGLPAAKQTAKTTTNEASDYERANDGLRPKKKEKQRGPYRVEEADYQE